MKVISVLLDENFRVYGVLALDYECIWVKSWKLKLVGLDEVWVNRKFKDLDYICRKMNKFDGIIDIEMKGMIEESRWLSVTCYGRV